MASGGGRHPSPRAQGLGRASPDFLGMGKNRMRASLRVPLCSLKPLPETFVEVKGVWGEMDWWVWWGPRREEVGRKKGGREREGCDRSSWMVTWEYGAEACRAVPRS